MLISEAYIDIGANFEDRAIIKMHLTIIVHLQSYKMNSLWAWVNSRFVYQTEKHLRKEWYEEG